MLKCSNGLFSSAAIGGAASPVCFFAFSGEAEVGESGSKTQTERLKPEHTAMIKIRQIGNFNSS